MISYIFMKILEMRPECYDARIGSHAGSIREEIVKKYVRPGMSMLDIGCGTGALLEMAARTGHDAHIQEAIEFG